MENKHNETIIICKQQIPALLNFCMKNKIIFLEYHNHLDIF